ncbi:hypothetical protein [Enterocloster lavalensis]|uniref:hypothetical protein n=1 Tax=Enterocloster lavalensis TaxID=460384 RepID=UPI001D05C3A9|nr:hypothetical protein [Enterocloster lavalensis]
MMKKRISELRKQMELDHIVPEKGLELDLFLMVSSMTPIVNIDLFVTDDVGRILFSWRDDKHCGRGWHIPGGCVRFKETLDKRIHLTAVDELGSDVIYSSRPLFVSENIANDELAVVQNHNERAHFISLLYDCKLVDESILQNCDGQNIVGHLKWFDRLPDDFLEIQYYYRPLIEDWFEKLRRKETEK